MVQPLRSRRELPWASSFARFKSASASSSLRRAAASEVFASKAAVFACWSSFSSVESAPVFCGSVVDDGREAESAAVGCAAGADNVGCTAAVDGAGCTVGVDCEDVARVVAARELAPAASALIARTSRAISRQVSNPHAGPLR